MRPTPTGPRLAPPPSRTGDAADTAAPSKVIPFPAARVVAAGPPIGPKPLPRRTARLPQWLGKLRRVLLRRRRRRFIEIDAVCSGQRLSVWVGDHYVRLSIDGRDYYFDRLTGRFDGAGTLP